MRILSCCFPSSPPIHPATESFEGGLTRWANKRLTRERRREAAERILASEKQPCQVLDLFHLSLYSLPQKISQLNHLTNLSLQDNKFTSVPRELGQLTQLRRLILCDNRVAVISLEIFHLKNLKILNLERNRIAEIPREIEQLTELEDLDLSRNQISFLPAEVEKLTKLKELNIDFNQLSSLPSQIGKLMKLEFLFVIGNQLRELPLEIGQLMSLCYLDVGANPLLDQLPLTLGHLPKLTELSTKGTQIPRDVRISILRQCRNLRDQVAISALPHKLATWQKISNNKKDLSKIEDFTESEKKILHEWLVRLERTKDFSTCQSSLANTVCDILASVISNDEFRALFFDQAEANNTHCQDRSAMSLNEIYLTWKILCMPEDTPLKEKLTLMTGCAKTLTLRNEIGNLYSEYRENVEVYLYCEQQLKERLGLVTAIQNMTYPDFAKKNSINPERLVCAVNDHFFDELYTLPIFEKTLMQDTEMAKKFEEITDQFQKKLEKGEIGQSKQLMDQLEKEKKQAASEWYKKKLENN